MIINDDIEARLARLVLLGQLKRDPNDTPTDISGLHFAFSDRFSCSDDSSHHFIRVYVYHHMKEPKKVYRCTKCGMFIGEMGEGIHDKLDIDGFCLRVKEDGTHTLCPPSKEDSKKVDPLADDYIAFGPDQFVYCGSHRRPHRTGWCTVSVSNKLGLGVLTHEEAVAKCRKFGLKLSSYDP